MWGNNTKTQDHTLIKKNLYYTTETICKTLRIDESTLRTWIRKGLKVIRKSPRVLRGEDIKEFLRSREQKRKCKLEDNEFYCVRCRTAVRPSIETITIENTGQKLGRYEGCWIKAICPTCGLPTRRFSSSRVVAIWREKGWVI